MKFTDFKYVRVDDENDIKFYSVVLPTKEETTKILEEWNKRDGAFRYIEGTEEYKRYALMDLLDK